MRWPASQMALADDLPLDPFERAKLFNDPHSWLRIHLRIRAYQWALGVWLVAVAIAITVGTALDYPGAAIVTGVAPIVLSVVAFYACQALHVLLLLEALEQSRGD